MKKTYIALGVFVLGIIPGAFAQGYSGNVSCVTLNSDVFYGSHGETVRELQNFLANRGYPGSGAWMVTGNFGRATEAAVRDFQSESHVPVTGFVDAATRRAISRASCGLLYSGQTYDYSPYGFNTNSNAYAPQDGTYYYSQPYSQSSQPFSYANYGYPYYGNSGASSYYYTSPYTYNYNYSYTGVTLSSLSANSGVPGASMTFYGSGFSASDTVYFGNVTATGYSNDGTTLSVIVPQMQAGTYAVSVQSTNGSSNSLQFTVVGGSCMYGNCGCTDPSVCLNTPHVYSVSPVNGGAGTSVTVYGSGFSSTGNTVHFGNGIIANLISSDGQSVSFTVPSTITGYGSQPLFLGTYPVSVTNGQGRTTNSLPFVVTSLISDSSPVIVSVSGPNTIGTGTSGTWTLTIDNRGGVYASASAQWGDPVYGAYMAAPQQVYGSGLQTVQFTHAYTQNGTYTITFTVGNSSGYTNTSSAIVQVSGTGTNGVTISSITPVSGRTGTQVLIQGSGFTNGNTIHFGIGGVLHLAAISGSTMYFTIPTTVSACDLITTGCASPTALVNTGSYNLYVTNTSGTSNTVTFNVQ